MRFSAECFSQVKKKQKKNKTRLFLTFSSPICLKNSKPEGTSCTYDLGVNLDNTVIHASKEELSLETNESSCFFSLKCAASFAKIVEVKT